MVGPIHHRLTAMIALPFMVAVSLACASCGKRAETTDADAQNTPAPTPRDELDIFAFGRIKGTVAPCGCTTEPLGGLPFAMGYIEQESKAGRRLVLEPGSLLFPDPKGPDAPVDDAAWAQAKKRAELLHFRLSQLGEGLVSGLGPLDFAMPNSRGMVNKLKLPRALANIKSAGGSPQYRILDIEAGARTVRVGVTAVTDPRLEGSNLIGPLTKMEPSVRKQIAKMREDGADLTIAMIHASRDQVEAIAKNVEGLDFAVVGYVEGTERQRLGAPVARVGDTLVLEPGEQLQTTTHVRMSIAPGAKIPGTGSWELVAPASEEAEELARLEARLAKFEKDPSADAAYLDRLRAERDAVKARLGNGAAFSSDVGLVVEQVKITCHHPGDARSKNALGQYDAWVAKENKKRFAEVTAPAPAKGEAGYAGIDECDACHDEAVTFWKDTLHAGAYDTLVRGNKQFDLSCVGCHVTGFRQPGGSEVVKNDGLTSVQCEACHGPGSLHAEDPEKNGTARNITREVPENHCVECHAPEHSDTFDYSAYLRDILGPGHGEEARAALGEGPTGRELRKAGLEKAGGACKEM